MALDILAAKAQAFADADLSDPRLLKLRDLIYRTAGIFHAERHASQLDLAIDSLQEKKREEPQSLNR